MRFRSLNHPKKANSLGLPGKIGGSGILALGAALCAQGIVAGPLYAAPTVGGDEEGPKVQIIQPAYQDVLKASARILVGIKANRFNPKYIEFFVDDNVVLPQTEIALAASSSFDWDTSKFTDGPHKLTVRITDAQGYRGWAEVYVYINNLKKRDTVPPSLNWLSVKPGDILAGTQQIKLKAVDNFGVKWIVVSLNPEATPDAKPPLRSWLVGQQPFNFNFDTTVVPDGIYVLQARAWDIFEQEGAANPLYVGISNSSLNTTTMQERLDMLNHVAKVNPVAVEPPSYTELSPKGPGNEAPPRKDPVALPPAPPVKQPVATPVKNPNGGGPAMVDIGTAGPKNPFPTPVASLPSFPAPRQLPPAPVSSAPAKAPVQVAKAPKAVTNVNPDLTKLGGGLSPKSIPSQARPVENTGAAGGTYTNNVAKVTPPAVKAPPRVAVNAQPEWPSDPAFLTAPVPRELNGSKAIDTAQSPAGNLVADLRLGAPAGEQREAPTWDKANLTPFKSGHSGTEVSPPAAIGRGEVENTFTGPERVAAPTGESRMILDAATMSNSGSAPRTAISAPNPVETPQTGTNYTAGSATAPNGAERPVPTLFARALDTVRDAIGLGGASLTAPATHATVTGSGRLPVDVEGETRVADGRVAEPTLGRKAPVVAPQPKVPQMTRDPRFAALPKNNGKTASASAITVSPLQLESGKRLPSVHVVDKAITLRALAAHYGVPAEVLAACNESGVDVRLPAGSRVKMPQELQVSYGGKAVKGDVSSLLVGTTSVTPFRFLWQQQGGTLEWDQEKKQVVAINGDHRIVLSIGSKTAKVDDKEVMMELAAFLMSGRTMVPVRLFEEGLHAQVEWDPATGRLFVAMAADPS